MLRAVRFHLNTTTTTTDDVLRRFLVDRAFFKMLRNLLNELYLKVFLRFYHAVFVNRTIFQHFIKHYEHFVKLTLGITAVSTKRLCRDRFSSSFATAQFLFNIIQSFRSVVCRLRIIVIYIMSCTTRVQTIRRWRVGRNVFIYY